MIKYITYIEISIGIGISIGPFIGAMVFEILHFEGTLYLMAGICAFGTLLCQLFLPKSLNITLSKDERKNVETEIFLEFNEVRE